MQTPLSFKFTPTEEDYIKAIRIFTWQDGITMSSLILVGVLFILLGVNFMLNGEFRWYWWFIMMAPPFVLLYLLGIHPLRVGQKAQKNARMICEMSWTVSDTGFQTTTKFAEVKSDWGLFHDFIEAKEYFLLVISANHRYFNFVPKRAFTSTE